jgi:hypothetical protein
MSTDTAVGPGVAVRTTRHPDQHLIDRLARALETWSQSSPTSPTSALTGGGAIAECEAEFSRLMGGRRAVLLPSATYGLYAALSCAGAGPGTEVIVAAIDWPASISAVRALGATPVIAGVAPKTLTVDVCEVARRVTPRTVAVVVCHLNGVCADVPSIRLAAPGVTVIEDCAGAYGASLDGVPAGMLGDLAVFSLGPGKQIDAGEGGVVICSDEAAWEHTVAVSAHPIRARLSGVNQVPGMAMTMRVHPMTAILALDAMAHHDSAGQAERRAAVLGELSARNDVTVLGAGRRRTNTGPMVAVLLADGATAEPRWVRSGAQLISPLEPHPTDPVLESLLTRSWLVPC